VWLFSSHHWIDDKTGGAPALKGWREFSKLTGPPLLFVCWKELQNPVAIPLELDLSHAAISARLLPYLKYGSGSGGSGGLAVQPVPTPAGIVVVDDMLGLWLIPAGALDEALRSAREERLARQQAQSAAAAGLWARLSAKYHLTGRDRLTPEQKEAMIGDPGFVELNLDAIDANHNGKLEAAELVFFDANQNGILDPPEQAGIDAALSLLAQRLMDEYDLDQDGLLDKNEFERLVADTRSPRPGPSPPPRFEQFDLNKDGALSSAELGSFLRAEMMSSFRTAVPPGANTAASFRVALEQHWGRTGTRPAGGPLRGTRAMTPPAQEPGHPVRQDPDQSLLEAVDSGNLEDAREAIQRGANVDLRDDRGRTPLMIAAKGGRLDMARLLVEKGADVNAQSTGKAGSTVLCFATESDNPELLAFLAGHGADVNAKSRNLATPLYLAVVNERRQATRYLLSHGARVNEPGPANEAGNRFTPFMGAVLNGDMETTRLLIEGGANLEETTLLGDTALMLLAKLPHPDILKVLIARGANVNAKGPHGHTAVIYAAYNGQIENLKLLLAAGADPSATAADDDGPDSPRYDALSLAIQQRHPEAEALVRQALQRKGPPGTKP
jgi:hypothetical protein